LAASILDSTPTLWANPAFDGCWIVQLLSADVAVTLPANILAGLNSAGDGVDPGLLPLRTRLCRHLCAPASTLVTAGGGGENRGADHIFVVTVWIEKTAVRQDANRIIFHCRGAPTYTGPSLCSL
jgi:hypothetical protein